MIRGVEPIFQPVFAGIVAAITGFASSFVLVIAGMHAVGASDAQAASALLALCLLVGLTCIVVPAVFKIPISFAWSTPGAALLVAAGGTTHNFGAAVGAFLVCGVLIVLTGLWPALGRAITSIPKPIASAMLAGILFPICLAPVTAAVEQPLLAIPVIVVWLVLMRFAARWAVPAAMVVAAIGIALTAGTDWLTASTSSPALVFTAPTFDAAVIVSLALPLFIVTMAGQNVPGFVVLSTFGYRPSPRPILVTSGLATVAGSVFGAHSINLAAITAALMASPEAHPQKSKRWIATLSSGVVYLVLGLGAGFAAALVAASPPILITAVAGLALLGALVTSITGALDDPRHRITAITTFLVTASGISILGIGSAFWGLAVGGVIMLWLGGLRRHTPTPTDAPRAEPLVGP
ncbi:benzoate/H(+) symporter BenE family transporter [Glaciibacter psychrotolerans]|uniref:Benzoate membrane transport protein n=1 Tax=Glaciibacter psychrotolerans TaxID=670054 RepID=A0A7Z0ED48_9MICO|nr:benzoate/H(+) symporter BenE family transporter [Leifsonia psychrotolerans]NYJ18970.1 benzoate membrane transport protein [Leifsonia psychrotolerans]